MMLMVTVLPFTPSRMIDRILYPFPAYPVLPSVNLKRVTSSEGASSLTIQSNCTPLTPPTVAGCGFSVSRYGWCWNQPTISLGAFTTADVVPFLVYSYTSWRFLNTNAGPSSPPLAMANLSEVSSGTLCQPLPTVKEKEGLNSSEWYLPGGRALGSSGRGRALASSCADPPAEQAPSASTNPTTTSAATTM